MQKDFRFFQDNCMDLYFRVSQKHQQLKDILCIFKKFMQLYNSNKLNEDTYNEYNQCLNKKIKDEFAFKEILSRLSNKFDVDMKYNETYLNKVQENKKRRLEDEKYLSLACDINSLESLVN